MSRVTRIPNPKLTDEQRKFFVDLTKAPGFLAILEGVAGSAKTTCEAILCCLLGKRSARVLIVALSNSIVDHAAREFEIVLKRLDPELWVERLHTIAVQKAILKYYMSGRPREAESRIEIRSIWGHRRASATTRKQSGG